MFESIRIYPSRLLAGAVPAERRNRLVVGIPTTFLRTELDASETPRAFPRSETGFLRTAADFAHDGIAVGGVPRGTPGRDWVAPPPTPRTGPGALRGLGLCLPDAPGRVCQAPPPRLLAEEPICRRVGAALIEDDGVLGTGRTPAWPASTVDGRLLPIIRGPLGDWTLGRAWAIDDGRFLLGEYGTTSLPVLSIRGMRRSRFTLP